MNQTAFISARDPQNSRAIPGAIFHFLAKGEDTAGRYSLMEIHVKAGNEPPAHTHLREDDVYFILKGEMRFEVGGQVLHAKPGDHVYLPKDVPHAFKVVTEDAHVLMWMAPAGLEQWFWDNSAPAPDMQPLPMPSGPPPAEAIEHFVRTLADYGVEMVGAPVEQ